jgi:dTDP-4-dehydrorhamnose reductase
MLGQALSLLAKNKGHHVIGVARSLADRIVDITDAQALRNLIITERPDIVVNTVALTDLNYCEIHPESAYMVNSRPSAILSSVCKEYGIYLLHISTDHFFSGDGKKKHDETSPVVLVNEYARTKYLAECLVKTYSNSLIVRTNIVGFRGIPNKPTFIEWCVEILEKKIPSILYDDFFTSSIDVTHFSEILLDLAEKKVNGLLNVASRDISSKNEFIRVFAERMGCGTQHLTTGSLINQNGIPRGDSLGLDVSTVENILGYNMPSREEVISNLIQEFRIKDRH